MLNTDALWTRCTVTLAIRDRIVGGVPANPRLIEGWLSANMPEVEAAERAKLAATTLADVGAIADEKAAEMRTTFKRDEQGIYLEGRCIKAAFKESANILREMLVKSETKGNGRSRYTNLKAKLAERLFVEDDKVRFLRDGQLLNESDGHEEKAIHVLTAQGPRSALARYDYIRAPALLRFTVRWLTDGLVDADLVRVLLEHGSWNGLGARRSQGEGCFDVVEIVPSSR